MQLFETEEMVRMRDDMFRSGLKMGDNDDELEDRNLALIELASK